jgi:Plasmid encoded RepA protein
VGEELQRQLFPDVEEKNDSIGFVTRLIIATTLPHSRPDDNEFTRHSGLYDLCLLAPRRIGLPWGIYPRLGTIWMATEAVQKQTPFLSLGATFSSFAWRLGITPSTGPKGTLTQLKDQLVRLANLTVSCIGEPAQSTAYSLPPSFSGGGVRLVKQYQFWWDDPAPSADRPHSVLLSDDFFKELLAHPVPVSLDVVRSFRSPMELDLYMWLTYRAIRTIRIGRPELVSWQALERQFGSAYAEVRMFRFNFLRALKKVLQVYPDVRLRSCRRGLTLLPYPPHVPRLKKR